MGWKKVFHTVEKTARIFHTVETFLPLCGKSTKSFSMVWKTGDFGRESRANAGGAEGCSFGFERREWGG